MSQAEDPLIGRLVDGRFRITAIIARGGMAVVYLANDARLDRRVAIKIMHAHLADDPGFSNRFVQEARASARLSHPNIVNVLDQGQDAGMAYLVMEYLPGMTLRDLLNRKKSLNTAETIDIMKAVLEGLAAAHRNGIIHRDLKPENVLLSNDGRIKLGDFGLARPSNANTATGQALLGTVAYLSPELVTRGVADARSDIYAAGIMMYEMLAGEQPYNGEQPMQIAFRHANDRVPAPSLKVPSVPRELDEIVLWATAREPEKRPADAAIMLDRLRLAEMVIVSRSGATAPQQTIRVRNTEGNNPTLRMRPDDPQGDTGKTTGKLAPSAVAKLSRDATRRRHRGLWLATMLGLITVLAVGAGWYYGAGPASAVTIPTTKNLSVDQAESLLRDAGIAYDTKTRNDLTVAKGLAADTNPAGGTSVTRGTTVTLYVSEGPRILPVANVAGKSEADARTALASFSVDPNSAKQFSTTVPSGQVIQATDADGKALPAQLPEQSKIKLVVSVGTIPDVTGKAKSDAEAALSAVGLKFDYADPAFSDTVPNGSVISMAPPDAPVSPGNTVTLTLSKGQDLVAVPNVVGESMATARKQLEGLGFTVQTGVETRLEVVVPVTTQTPAGGTQAKRGSKIQLAYQ